MMDFYVIANHTVGMDLKCERLLESAEKYRVDRLQKVDIMLTDYEAAAYRNHQLVPAVSEEQWVEILSADDFYDQLLNYNGRFLHSSAVVVEGKAYLISAGSQVGKSTHTKLWKDYLGEENIVILNDDKPAIMRDANGTWFAFGTPWSGASDSNLNMCAPIGGVCVLERSDINWIQPEKGPRILDDLLEQTLKPRDERKRSTLINLFSNMVTTVPTYRMGVNMSIEAAQMAYEFMTGRVQL
jgi:hypothetical protein